MTSFTIAPAIACWGSGQRDESANRLRTADLLDEPPFACSVKFADFVRSDTWANNTRPSESFYLCAELQNFASCQQTSERKFDFIDSTFLILFFDSTF